MECEILFRGKRLDNGKWWYGSYLFLHVSDKDWTGTERGPAKDVHFIVDKTDLNYAVDPATVGQYTGLTGKNGVKIFDGDILKTGNALFVVRYGHCGGVQNVDHEVGYVGFYVEPFHEDAKELLGFDMRTDILYWLNAYGVEVIGSVHDNPDLLRGLEE